MNQKMQKLKNLFNLWVPAVLGALGGGALGYYGPLPDIKSIGFYLIIGLVVAGYCLMFARVLVYVNYFFTTSHKLVTQLRKCPGQGGLISHVTNFFLMIALMMGWAILGCAIRFDQVPALGMTSETFFAIYLGLAGILGGMYYQFHRFYKNCLAYERGDDLEKPVFRWEFFWTQLFFLETRQRLPDLPRPDHTPTLTPDDYKEEAAAIMKKQKTEPND